MGAAIRLGSTLLLIGLCLLSPFPVTRAMGLEGPLGVPEPKVSQGTLQPAGEPVALKYEGDEDRDADAAIDGVEESLTCGVERWAVKTGTDADVGLVNTALVTPTTIGSLTALTAPATLPASNRVQPTETTVFQLTCTLVEFKLETDNDYHLVLSDGAGHTMIAEIPNPGCVGSSSPFLSAITGSRSTFDATYTATSSFQTVNVPVQVTGVGFFDFLHGQTGVAPNGIEIHPILNLVFNPSTSADFSLSASPNSLSVAQGGTGAVTLSTAVTGGFSSPVTLSASGLPTGVTAAFNPSSIAAPGAGSSTVTLSASSTATTASTPITLTASGGTKTHSASLSLTVTSSGGGGTTTVTNGDFETGNLTGWTAGTGTGTVAPVASTTQRHGGSYSAYLAGSVAGSASNCTLSQSLAVPAGGGTLSFWYYPVSGDSITYDWQEMDILNSAGTVAATPLKVASNTQAWTQVTYGLSAYAGQTITLKFTVHDDGYSGDQTNMYVDDVTVTPPASTYSISGTVSGAIASGVTMTLSGAASATATTSSTGAYTFGSLANGTYTVTPSLSGYTFSPTSASVTVNGSNATANFTATAVTTTYSISGTVGGAVASGVTMTLSGAASATATTSSTGTYTFGSLANGTYTVTPSLSGYTFSPTSTSVTLSGANQTGIGFTASSTSTTSQILLNPGFESGNNGSWTLSTSPTSHTIITTTTNPSGPHGGAYMATLCQYNGTYYNSQTDSIRQTVTIPAGATTATLSFWYYIKTQETTTSTAYDKLTVTVENTSGTVLATLTTLSNLNHTSAWTQKTGLSLLSYKGQTVVLRFKGTTDSSLGTAFLLDDLSLMANGN